MHNVNPSGLCLCGCGGKTWVATMTNKAKGNVKGMPVRYVRGHGPNIGRGESHYGWKGDAAAKDSGRMRARRKFRVEGQCESCKCVPAVDRHHVDGNPLNNDPSNIARLCRKCHMLADDRLKNLVENAIRTAPTKIKPPKPCSICHEPSTKTRKGRCHACAEFFRRMGFERSIYLAYRATKKATA